MSEELSGEDRSARSSDGEEIGGHPQRPDTDAHEDEQEDDSAEDSDSVSSSLSFLAHLLLTHACNG